MPRLIVINRSISPAERVYDLLQDQIGMGRDDDNDIVLAERSVSRHHAEILYDRHDYYLVDLRSGNGTCLNGKAVHPGEHHLLRSNDIIAIDPFEIHFISHAENEEEPSHVDDEITDTDIIEIKMIKKVLKALDSDLVPSLQVASGTGEGKRIFLTPEMTILTIGRDESCGLPIVDASVSRTHATVERKWGGWVITDLDSKNGTFINGERIREKRLADGDQLMIGTIKVLYRNPQDVSLSAINRDYKRDGAPSLAVHPSANAASNSTESASQEVEGFENSPEPDSPSTEDATHSDAAQATSDADRGTPPKDEDVQNVFTPESSAESKSMFPKITLAPVAHVLRLLLIALGGVVFLAALAALLWLVMK